MNLSRIDGLCPERAVGPTVASARSGSFVRGIRRPAIQSGCPDRIHFLSLPLSPTYAEALETLAQVNRIRERMGHFLINIIVVLCFYAVVLAGSSRLPYDVGITILISAGLLLGLVLAGILIVLKRGIHSLEFYGLTNRQWIKRVINSIVYSSPIIATLCIAVLCHGIVPARHLLGLAIFTPAMFDRSDRVTHLNWSLGSLFRRDAWNLNGSAWITGRADLLELCDKTT